jgi:hypothetical protein
VHGGQQRHWGWRAPALSNDVAGTFTAFAGSPTGHALLGWNSDWYIDTGIVAGKTVMLHYDFDPVACHASQFQH